MSWLSGLKGTSTSKPPEPKVSPRTAKRNRLQEERLQRAKQRERLRKQLKSAQEAKEAADLAEAELFALDPSIFQGEVDEDISLDILEDDPAVEEVVIMTDFDAENGTDGKGALGDLKGVQCPFIKDDIEFWFGQLANQITEESTSPANRVANSFYT